MPAPVVYPGQEWLRNVRRRPRWVLVLWIDLSRGEAVCRDVEDEGQIVRVAVRTLERGKPWRLVRGGTG